MKNVKYAIDVLCKTNDYDELFANKRIGLITSLTGMTSDFKSTADALNEKYGVCALFAPEHGVRGSEEAGESVDSYIDEKTGICVYSLYRKNSKRLSKEMLQLVDVMVYDIQDVGSRFYTYLYTMLYALEDCAKAGIPFVVLDRPNPLGGISVQGNITEQAYRSFVGDYPMCMRYGLTVGELAIMANAQQNWGAKLTVIKCEGWRREMLWPDTGLLWAAPSPALTSFESALLYSGTCIFEGTNLSEGRGTAAPFMWIGAPYIKDPESLAQRLNNSTDFGIKYRPIYFTPQYNKYEKQLCRGVQLHITKVQTAMCISAALALLYEVKSAYSSSFEWCTPLPPATRPHIELLGGSGDLMAGLPLEDLMRKYKADEDAFFLAKQKYHLY